jgi:dTDP-4-amino-4,6-dideoxygalactose transaminase
MFSTFPKTALYPLKGVEMMKIPLFDMTRQYFKIRQEILEALDGVLSSGRVILGENVRSLEEKLARFIGVKHGVGVANGSDALLIALRALGIKQGDYVITTPYTFFATASCIVRLGGTPVFVDIDPDTYNIDLEMVESIFEDKVKIKVKGEIVLPEKIKAVIPVHLFGQTVDLERLEKLKKRYDLKILEDAAQSIGSTWIYTNGITKKSGSVGDASIVSFFPTKNLGAYGDGGMIFTDNEEIADTCRMLRTHGAKQKYFHEVVGYNSRLDEIQAAILKIKFKYLDEYTKKRIEIAKNYSELFETESLNEIVKLPNFFDDGRHVYHQYVVEFKNEVIREHVRKKLLEKGIGCAVYYPLPLHLQKCFQNLGYKAGDLPNSEKASKTTLALPIFPELEFEEQKIVVSTIADALKELNS